MTIRTALLEARYLWGEQPLFRELRQRFLRGGRGRQTGPDFVEAKLRRARRAPPAAWADSRYVARAQHQGRQGRPARSAHAVLDRASTSIGVDDVAELIDARRVHAERSRDASTRRRTSCGPCAAICTIVTGRAEERLTFDLQPELAHRMGYTDRAGTRGVERFMKHYFLVAKDVGDLTRIFCAALEAEHQRRALAAFAAAGLLQPRRSIEGFRVEGGRLTVAGPTTVSPSDPVEMLRLFHVAQTARARHPPRGAAPDHAQPAAASTTSCAPTRRPTGCSSTC